jgi:hypothetical protein
VKYKSIDKQERKKKPIREKQQLNEREDSLLSDRQLCYIFPLWEEDSDPESN